MSFDSGRGPPNIEGMTSLKVDNLTYRTGIEDLKKLFGKYGEVGDIYIPRDRKHQQSRGFAFVRFWEKRDAEDAMDKMDRKVVDGREIRVQMARYGRPTETYKPSRRDSRGYGGGGGRYRSRSRSRSPRRRRSRYSRSRSRSPKRRYSRSRSPRWRRSRSYSPRRSRSPVRRESRSRSRSRSLRRYSKSRSRSPVNRSRSPVRSRSRSISPKRTPSQSPSREDHNGDYANNNEDADN